MPLMTCPDCGREHSDLASACPQCARPNVSPLPAPTTPPPVQQPSAPAVAPLSYGGYQSPPVTASAMPAVVAIAAAIAVLWIVPLVLVPAMIALSAGAAWLDARNIEATRRRRVGGWSSGAWVVWVLLLWIVAAPLYLYRRSEVMLLPPSDEPLKAGGPVGRLTVLGAIGICLGAMFLLGGVYAALRSPFLSAGFGSIVFGVVFVAGSWQFARVDDGRSFAAAALRAALVFATVWILAIGGFWWWTSREAAQRRAAAEQQAKVAAELKAQEDLAAEARERIEAESRQAALDRDLARRAAEDAAESERFERSERLAGQADDANAEQERRRKQIAAEREEAIRASRPPPEVALAAAEGIVARRKAVWGRPPSGQTLASGAAVAPAPAPAPPAADVVMAWHRTSWAPAAAPLRSAVASLAAATKARPAGDIKASCDQVRTGLGLVAAAAAGAPRDIAPSALAMAEFFRNVDAACTTERAVVVDAALHQMGTPLGLLTADLEPYGLAP